MTRYRIAELLQRGAMIMALRRGSAAETVELTYHHDRAQHRMAFIVEIWDRVWNLGVWLDGYEIDGDRIEQVVARGNGLIQDVLAHYRQQAVAR